MNIQTLINDNATIIVAAIGAIVSVATLVLGKHHEQKVELRKIKEKQYISFLCNIVKVKSKIKDDETFLELSQRTQTIFLVGNKRVQKALQQYLLVLRDKCDMPQEVAYGKLIQAMKLDLYGRKYFIQPSNFVSLNSIELVDFIE